LKTLLAIDYFIIIYLSMANAIYALQAVAMLIRSARLRRFGDEATSLAGEASLLPISLITVLRDDEDIAVEYIDTLLGLNYPIYEVIAVCDGTTDSTINLLIAAYGLEKVSFPVRMRLKCAKISAVYMNPEFPGFIVVDKARAGQPDSLNCGLNVSRYSLYAQTDIRYLVDPQCLRKAAEAMRSDERVACVFSPFEAINYEEGKATFFERLSTAEYLKDLLISPIAPGLYRSRLHFCNGFSMANKERVIRAGGYGRASRFAAFDLAMKLNAAGGMIAMLGEPVCSYFADYDYSAATTQAARRGQELAENLYANRSKYLNFSYRAFGALCLPYYVFVELLAPLIELIGLALIPVTLGFGIASLDMLAVYILSTVVSGAALSALAVSAFRRRYTPYRSPTQALGLLASAVIANFGYRQIISAVSLHAAATAFVRSAAAKAQ